MRIMVPAADADGNRIADVAKEITVNCGVTIRIEGSRWQAQGTVVRIIDENTV